jgi:hypothetical protein
MVGALLACALCSMSSRSRRRTGVSEHPEQRRFGAVELLE